MPALYWMVQLLVDDIILEEDTAEHHEEGQWARCP